MQTKNNKPKILFVCRGNFARSQFALEFFRRLHSEIEAMSAGTRVIGKDGISRHGQKLYEAGEAGNNVILSMRERGFEVSNNVRTQLDEQMANDADLIVVIAEKDNWPEYLKNNPKVIFWDVLDPKGEDLDFHRKVRDRVFELVNRLEIHSLKI